MEPRQKIEIVDYDPAWPDQFTGIAARIRELLGSVVLSLEHIGSTAVPGLAAKPRIDVTMVLGDSSREVTYAPQLEAAGYTLVVREPGWY